MGSSATKSAAGTLALISSGGWASMVEPAASLQQSGRCSSSCTDIACSSVGEQGVSERPPSVQTYAGSTGSSAWASMYTASRMDKNHFTTF